MKRRGARGVTLLEVMTVVAIIGILSALAGPNMMQAIRSARVGAAVRTLQGRIGAARINAVSRGLPEVFCIAGKAAPKPNFWWVYVKGTSPSTGGNIIPGYELGYDAAAAAPLNDRSLDQGMLSPDQTELVLPLAGIGGMTENQVLQLAFDMNGQLSQFVADDCLAGTPRTPFSATINFAVQRNDALEPMTQTLVLKTDSTMAIQ